MINFWITGRPPTGVTREKYDYEWGVIHASLMLTTAAALRAFTRYSQNRSIDALVDGTLPCPQPAAGWYGVADHELEDPSDLLLALGADRLTTHHFADTDVALEITTPDIVYERDETRDADGGVRVLTFLRRPEDLSPAEFSRVWRAERAPQVLADTTGLRRYVQHAAQALDPAIFSGTLFAQAGRYAGVEEQCYDSLDDALAPRPALPEPFAGPGSFSLAVVERVVFDRRLTASEPAVWNADSLEARAVATERPGAWNAVR